MKQKSVNEFFHFHLILPCVSYFSEIKALKGFQRLRLISQLGKLALYARLYRSWVRNPRSGLSGFDKHFPEPPVAFHSWIYDDCSTKITVDYVWYYYREKDPYYMEKICVKAYFRVCDFEFVIIFSPESIGAPFRRVGCLFRVGHSTFIFVFLHVSCIYITNVALVFDFN